MNNQQQQSRLENFPISFFSIIMGLSGLTIAWEKAQIVFNTSLGITPFLLGATSSIFIILLLIYTFKIILYPQSVVKELRHPIKLSFFPSISISFLLLSIAFLNISEVIAYPLWVSGTILHFGLTLYIINTWMHHDHFKVNHINPAWFIPAVGNMVVPITGVALGFIDVSWFFFSVGIVFWIILMVIFFNRILFHNPMDTHLLPTLFILIAPPAVGFISYVRLNGEIDNFANILYFIALFLTMLLFSQAKRFIRLPFFLSWWAYSFPLSAIIIASFVVYDKTQSEAYLWIASSLLMLVTALIVIIVTATLKAIYKKEICVAES